jgi:hypothetical protein
LGCLSFLFANSYNPHSKRFHHELLQNNTCIDRVFKNKEVFVLG